MNWQIRKNILDLQFQKYINIVSTTIIIAFTYLIGLSIAFITDQISLSNLWSILSLVLISAVILFPCIYLFVKAYLKIREIPKEIQNIK